MDMFEYFAKERLQNQRRRETREYLTRPPLTPQISHPIIKPVAEVSTLETPTNPHPATTLNSVDNKSCRPPLPSHSMGSRDQLFKSQFVQTMKMKWEEKMKIRNPLPPSLYKCGQPVLPLHELRNSPIIPIQPPTVELPESLSPKAANASHLHHPIGQFQLNKEENFNDFKSQRVQKSIETQTVSLPLPEAPRPSITQTQHIIRSVSPLRTDKTRESNTDAVVKLTSTTHERHSYGVNLNPTRPSLPPPTRKERRSLVQHSVEGLLPAVEHSPEFQAPHLPPLFLESSVRVSTTHSENVTYNQNRDEELSLNLLTESKKRGDNSFEEFDTRSFISRVSSETDSDLEKKLNEEQKRKSSAANYNGNYADGQTYALESFMGSHRISGDKGAYTHYHRHSHSLNSTRPSNFEEDDDSYSSIALEVDGLKHPRRATATSKTLQDELLLLSLNREFDDTIQQEVEPKSDQVYKSKSEVNVINGTDMETIAKSLSQENMHSNNPTRRPTITETTTTAISVHETTGGGSKGKLLRKLSTTLRKTSSGYHVCHGCKKLVMPEDHSFQIQDGHPHVWHQSCFVCKTCAIQLGHMDHLFYEDEPYCYQHYILIAHVPSCRGCGEHIFDPSYTSAAGCYWHKDHFVCQSCRIPLVDTKYVGVHGHVFCFSCHEKEFTKICETCHQQILPREFYVQSGQYFWHSNDSCLHCETCGQSLVGRALFFRRNKKLFCNRYCAMRRNPSV